MVTRPDDFRRAKPGAKQRKSLWPRSATREKLASRCSAERPLLEERFLDYSDVLRRWARGLDNWSTPPLCQGVNPTCALYRIRVSLKRKGVNP